MVDSGVTMHRFALALVAAMARLGAAGADAAIIEVIHLAGLPGLIIAPPAEALDDAIASATHMLGFDERQNVTLTADLAVDGGAIPAGTTVSSHMILLNMPTGLPAAFGINEWRFAGRILGVMSDRDGRLEAASTAQLGAPQTHYPQAGYGFRGIETNDRFAITAPNVLRVELHVWQPGDWIRVITGPAPVAEGGAPAISAM